MTSVPYALSFGLHPQVTRPKMQHLRVEQGVPVERPSKPRMSPDDITKGLEDTRLSSSAPIPESKGSEDRLPDFVTKAGLTLCFGAWYAESVPESEKEECRIRKVNIIHYLEDGTTSIMEPTVLNSGLPQRKILQRHKIPRAATDPDALSEVVTLPGARHTDFLTWRDFHVGSQMFLYGKCYNIASCNEATRKWYEREDAENGGLGDLEQAPDEECPDDAYTSKKSAAMRRETGVDSTLYRGRKLSPVKRYMEASRGNSSAVITKGIKDKSAQWRKHDSRECLRFLGLLDETHKPHGDRLRYKVHYYLCDDTMELLEIRTPNDGRDRFSALWKRARLPKHIIFQDSRSRDIEADKGDEDYYELDDLCVGSSINVMGRSVLLYDADPKTIEWYQTNRGIDMTATAVDTAEPTTAATVVTPPDYLGFGTEEDSLNSFFSLQMRRPRKNWEKINKFDGMILRYHAKFANPSSVPDIDREFTVSFFPASDSIAIYEPPKKNSGVLGGKFLSKTRLRNPETGHYFTLDDFVVGKTINVRGFIFLLEACDKQTKELLDEMARS